MLRHLPLFLTEFLVALLIFVILVCSAFAMSFPQSEICWQCLRELLSKYVCFKFEIRAFQCLFGNKGASVAEGMSSGPSTTVASGPAQTNPFLVLLNNWALLVLVLSSNL